VVSRYGVVLVSVALATAGSLLFDLYTQQNSMVLFVVAVMFSAWYGGLGAGICCTAVSVFVINFVVLHPPLSIDFNAADLPRLGFFLLVALFINWLEESRLRAEALLHERQTQMEHLAKLTGMNELATGIAHELNQPLTAISIYCQTCLSDPETRAGLSPQVLEAMQRISAQSRRAGQILAGFRRTIRRQPPERRPTDVHGLLVDSLNLIHTDRRRFRIHIHTEFEAQTAVVICDEVEIGQVLINLLQNAIDAAAERPGVREVTITTRGNDETMTIAIRNSGTVVPAGRMDQAFEPFFTTKPGGLGMGLKISRSIVESHGGKLVLRANPEGGATAEFSLPLAGTDAATPDAPEVPPS